jgi:hypothetical protein
MFIESLAADDLTASTQILLHHPGHDCILVIFMEFSHRPKLIVVIFII